MAVVFASAFGRVFAHAQAAVNRGIRVTASRSALRQGGLRFSNQAYSQAHAIAVRLQSIRRLEIGANLLARPGANRILRGPWKGPEKWGQVVQLTVRDSVTGGIRVWDVNLPTDRLMTRQAAIDLAVTKVAPDLEGYQMELIGAQYAYTRGQA